MNITVISVGKIKEKYFTAAIDEYSKRLSRFAKLNIIEVADEKIPDNASEKEMEQIKEKEGNTSLLSAQYTLLPVWTVRYDYRDSEYTFLMNGQTGKVAGNPPLSLPKLAVGFGLIATFLFIFLRIFTALLGGPVL